MKNTLIALVLALAVDATARGGSCLKPLKNNLVATISADSILAFANARASLFDLAELANMAIEQGCVQPPKQVTHGFFASIGTTASEQLDVFAITSVF